MNAKDQAQRLKWGPEPQTIEDLRKLQEQIPPPGELPHIERFEERRTVDWPIQIFWQTSDGSRRTLMAQAREVSSTSVYFEIDAQDRLSSPNLLLELEAGQKISLCAFARVSRVEAKEGKIGIAVILEDYCFRGVQ